MRFRLSAPLPANPRMENFFERAFLGCVLKDYGPEIGPVQVAVAGKDGEPELFQELAFDLLKIDKLMRDVVGIEKFRGGNNLAQAFAKRRFARGNSARDPNGRHFKIIILRLANSGLGSLSRGVFLCARKFLRTRREQKSQHAIDILLFNRDTAKSQGSYFRDPSKKWESRNERSCSGRQRFVNRARERAISFRAAR